jgi:Recombination endonuclease VII
MNGDVAPTAERLFCKQDVEGSNPSVSTRECKKCKVFKRPEAFSKNKKGPGGLAYYCKECERRRSLEYYYSEKDSARAVAYVAARRSRDHGHTEQEIEDMYRTQEKSCAGCRDPKDLKDLVIDHDHSCCPSHRRSCGKCTRGLLCHRCNMTLGNFEDSSEKLGYLVAYLKNDSTGL